MSKQSRARAAAEAATGAKAPTATSEKASAASSALPSDRPNPFLIRWGTLVAGVVVVLAALAAYHNSFSGPFVLDDPVAITDNLTIRHFGSALVPPSFSGATTAGRPVINLTFALNYALGGMKVWGYHAFNLLIHMLAGLTLFGIVRRTLRERSTFNVQHPTSKSNNPIFPELSSADALMIALAVAILWVVHPLQTEAVTYVSQRAESLMGLFYLLTLYFFVRGAESRLQESGVRNQEKEFKIQNPQATLPLSSGLTPDASSLWYAASLLACLLGMATKEVMVSAPLMVLLYDRTFIAGSFGEAWQLRWRYYLVLACTWLLLAWLTIGLGQRSVGFNQGVTWWIYALTSCRSVVLYGKLALWPHPLVFDYGTHFIRHATEAVPYALILAALLVGTMIALRRWPAIGFLGAWFFVILAPTSSVVPVALQPTAEHRMYLSLAAVVVLGVLGLHRLAGRRGLAVGVAVAVGLGWLAIQRNKDYHSELAIWSDTVTKCPDNARARNNLGNALFKIPGRLPDAMAQYEAALGINPDFAEAHDDFGNALLKMPGHLPDAIAQFETALRLDPDSAKAHNNLGNALMDVPGRLPGAMAEFEAALRLNPDLADAHNNLGTALLDAPGRLPDAIAEFEAALRINPDSMEAHDNLGIVFFKMPGRLPDAITQFEAALRLDPDSMEAHSNLGSALLNEPGRLPDAIVQYEAAVQLDPGSAKAHYNLGNALLNMPGRMSDAIGQLQAALRINPDLASARELLNQLQNPNGLEGAAPMDSPLHSNDKP
jgi:tetratricopeptide (TPR) repeat protein